MINGITTSDFFTIITSSLERLPIKRILMFARFNSDMASTIAMESFLSGRLFAGTTDALRSISESLISSLRHERNYRKGIIGNESTAKEIIIDDARDIMLSTIHAIRASSPVVERDGLERHAWNDMLSWIRCHDMSKGSVERSAGMPMIMSCDILVIGAGPAGISAAYFTKSLSMNNDTTGKLDVIVVDRLEGKSYVKYHVKCGEAVSERFFEDVRPLEKRCIVNNVTVGREIWAGVRSIDTPIHGYIIDRPAYLSYVKGRFLEIGGIIINDTFVNAVDTSDYYIASFDSGLSIKTKIIIGADGANSRVRSIFGFGAVKKDMIIQHIIDDEGNKNVLEFSHNHKYGGGYKYIFPSRNDQTKVGFWLDTDTCNVPIIARHGRFVAWGGLDAYVKGNVALIGDAAAQCNPLTWGGIRTAFVGGKMLAKYIVNDDISGFNKKWKRSPYESSRFVGTHDHLASMDDGELARFARPFSARGSGVAWSLLKNMKYWKMYADLVNADKYTW